MRRHLRRPHPRLEETVVANQNKAAQQELNRQASAGAKKHLKGTVQLGGKSYKVSDIEATLEAPTAAADATAKAKAAYRAAVAEERMKRVGARTLWLALQSYVVGMNGETSTVVADFGFVPKQQPPKPVEVKAEAVVKMRATRKARGTLGKKQKAKIKGTVEVDATEYAALTSAAASTAAATTTTTPATGTKPSGT
jgi:hypothetical protein